MAKTQQTKKGRRALSWLWIYFLKLSGLLAWAQRRISAASGVVVLTLHRVLPDPAFQQTNSPEGMVLRRQTFERLLSFLSQNFEVVNLQGDLSEPRRKPKRPRIALTFDDGWRDTAVVAYPLAVEHRIPFTVFVCSGLAGQSSPFWPEQVTRAWQDSAESASKAESFSLICESAFPGQKFVPASVGRLEDLIGFLKTLPSAARNALVQDLCALSSGDSSTISELEATMSWEEMKAMDQGLCGIGSHSQSHEILTSLPLDRARQEIANSKKQIEEHLGHECAIFAYPNGSWSREVRVLAEQGGYKQAFINSPGVWTPDTDAWLIPRVNIWEGSLTNRSGEFSATMFQYTAFWRACTKLDKSATPF